MVFEIHDKKTKFIKFYYTLNNIFGVETVFLSPSRALFFLRIHYAKLEYSYNKVSSRDK